MTCTVEQRDRVRAAAEELAALDAIAAVDTVPADADPTDRWALDGVVSVGYSGVPPAALRGLARHGLALRSVAPQGYNWQFCAVAEHGE